MAEQSTVEIVIKSIFMSVFIVLAIIGNIIVCIAIKKYKRLQTMTNYYVFNLAIADLLYGLTGMPMLLITTVAGRWILGPALCQLSGTLQTLFVLVSIWTLCLIGVNRYFAVGKHSSYKSIYKKKRVFISIGSVWFTAGLISIAPHFGWSSILQGDNFCTINGKDDISYSIFVILFAYIAPLVLLTGLYTKIFFLLKEHEKKMTAMRGSRKETRTESDFDSVDMSSTYKMENIKTEVDVRDVRFDNGGSMIVQPPVNKELSCVSSIPSESPSSMIKEDGVEVNSNINTTNEPSADAVESPDQSEESGNKDVVEESSKESRYLDTSTENHNQDEGSNNSRTASGSGVNLIVYTKQSSNITFEGKDEGTVQPRKTRTLSSIANALKKRRSTNSKKIKKFRLEAKITKMLFVVVAVFFICWTPLVIGTVLYAFNAEPKNFNLLSLGFVVASMNSICNPIIYAFMNQPFRKAFKDLMTGCKSRADESHTES